VSSEHLQPRPRGNCSGRVRQLLAAWLHDWDRLYKPRPLFVWEGYLLEQGWLITRVFILPQGSPLPRRVVRL